MGFYANQLNSLYFQLPFILVMVTLFYNLFYLLFKYRVSLYLRKYSLLGIIFFMLLDGNFEQFGFYIFGELNYFFSIDFTHKLANLGILFILFILIIFSVGGLLYLKFHYKKLVNYFIQYYGPKTASLIFESGERMLFPLVFGCIHALLINKLLIQTISLAFLELCYLVVKIISFSQNLALKKMKVSLAFVGSGLRIIFIITFYVYNVT